jgi:ATP-binding protein involved in chromosome partitioning
MGERLEQAVREALRGVRDPATGRDVIEAGMVEGLAVRDGMVQFAIQVPRERARDSEPLRAAAERAAAAVPGVLSATVVLTAHRAEAPAKPAATAPGAKQQAGQGPMLLPEVGAIIAVASGKGGVGKSTTAVNLASRWRRRGCASGCSTPTSTAPPCPRCSARGSGRGPRGSASSRCSAGAEGDVHRLPRRGGDADDLARPDGDGRARADDGPGRVGAARHHGGGHAAGTGDAQLTMSQRVPLAGAVIVSTPQDVRLIDARRGVRMFESVGVPVLGLVENMSFYCCPNCGHREELFGHGGAREEAGRLGVEFLGELPLKLAIRQLADAGTPIVAAKPETDEAKAYQRIAARLWAKLAERAGAKAGPRIVVE